ncbi:MAG TPA: ribosome maturation factor RimM [Vicinamibacterales bacterium]|nr:ribosome maturation factor RimM [Vicinamibacterales bacterium]
MEHERDLLLVGRIARAHGNRGQVIVNPETDFPEARFVVGQTLRVEQGGRGSDRRIISVRFHQGRPIVGLEGIETMNDAEGLAGADLTVERTDIAPLSPGTFYHHDLVGCEVRDTSGRSIGTVVRVDGPMDRSLLAVDGNGGEVLVPFVGGICVTVDPSTKVIVVDPPEGLIELNERTSGR